MIAEIIATGDEIRSGALVDSNSAYIAEKLEAAGISVVRHHAVGDDLEVLRDLFREAGRRADVILVTGGLGPTTDDLTAEAAALAAGVERVLDPVALEAIEAFFRERGRPVTDSNRKQALLPKGAGRLDNPLGTAPGFSLKIGRGTFFCLPGVPHEMRRMLKVEVLAALEGLQGGRRRYRLVRNLSTFGLTESMTGERVAGFAERFPEIKLGFRAKFPEIHLKFYVEGEKRAPLEDLLDRASRWVGETLGDYVLSLEGESLEQVVGGLLAREGATLALAESCTGGLLASRLTDVAGSSDYFVFSGVTYANEAKVAVLGVSPRTLEAHGAVHEETAREMAAGARRVAGATYGLAITGVAGPSGGTAEKPVGTVCIGLAAAEGVKGFRYFFPFGKRLMNKRIFAANALDLLRRRLLKQRGEGEVGHG